MCFVIFVNGLVERYQIGFVDVLENDRIHIKTNDRYLFKNIQRRLLRIVLLIPCLIRQNRQIPFRFWIMSFAKSMPVFV